MGRYRPPRQRGSRYITPEGEQALRDELQQLWKVERPVVTNAVHEAAKNGDRSENGDYIYGKRRLREIARALSTGQQHMITEQRQPVVLAVLTEPRFHTALSLIYACGLRLSEAVNLHA